MTLLFWLAVGVYLWYAWTQWKMENDRKGVLKSIMERLEKL